MDWYQKMSAGVIALRKKKDKKMLTVLFFEISVFMKKLKPSVFVQCE